MKKIICPKCEKELKSVRVGVFDNEGQETFYEMRLVFDEFEIYFEMENDGLSSYYIDEDYHNGITCPYCSAKLFTINNDIKLVNVERIVLSEK